MTEQFIKELVVHVVSLQAQVIQSIFHKNIDQQLRLTNRMCGGSFTMLSWNAWVKLQQTSIINLPFTLLYPYNEDLSGLESIIYPEQVTFRLAVHFLRHTACIPIPYTQAFLLHCVLICFHDFIVDTFIFTNTWNIYCHTPTVRIIKSHFPQNILHTLKADVNDKDSPTLYSQISTNTDCQTIR